MKTKQPNKAPTYDELAAALWLTYNDLQRFAPNSAGSVMTRALFLRLPAKTMIKAALTEQVIM